MIVIPKVVSGTEIIPACEVLPYSEVLELHGWQMCIRFESLGDGGVLIYVKGVRYIHPEAPVKVKI